MSDVSQTAVDAADSTGKAGAEISSPQGGNAESSSETKAALDSFLADENNKAAYDAAVESAVAAALEKQKEDAEEAKRVAKLSKEERLAEREKEMDEREAQLQAGERKAAAKEELSKAGIPAKLAECLNYSSKEAYEQSFTAAKEAFQEAVEAAVNDRLRGKGQVIVSSGATALKTVTNQTLSADKEFAEMLRAGRARR